MKGIFHNIRNEKQLNNLIKALRDTDIGDFGYQVQISEGKRTLKQNASLWKYCTMLAESLNNAGLEIHMEYLGKSIDVPWTKDSAKERLWNPIMTAMFKVKSSTKLERSQVSAVYEVLSRHMGEQHEIVVPFPSDEPPML